MRVGRLVGDGAEGQRRRTGKVQFVCRIVGSVRRVVDIPGTVEGNAGRIDYGRNARTGGQGHRGIAVGRDQLCDGSAAVVGDVDVAGRIDRDGLGSVETAVGVAHDASGAQLGDRALSIVGDPDIAVGVHCDTEGFAKRGAQGYDVGVAAGPGELIHFIRGARVGDVEVAITVEGQAKGEAE